MENKTEHTTKVPKKHGKIERIAAWIGIILLIALYVTTLISAILALLYLVSPLIRLYPK